MEMNSYLPLDWEDDERMRVMMSPMPSAKDNVAVNSRITFWKAALHNWAAVKKGISFTLSDALNEFRRSTQIPLCLCNVIQHLLKEGDLITQENLLKPASDNQSWAEWSKRILVTNPLNWAWSTVQNTLGKNNSESEIFIDIKVLQEKSDQLLCLIWGSSKDEFEFDRNALVSVEDLFRLSSGKMDLTVEDLNIMLHYLLKRKKILIKDYNGASLVKILKPGQTDPLTINDMEVAEYQLRATERLLEERLESMQSKMEELRLKAKASLDEGSRNKALSYLRMKNRCSKSFQMTLSALENLTKCLYEIQESKLNMNVLNSFQAGINGLKYSVSVSGGVNKAEDTMDTLQDLLDECNSVSDTLAFGISEQPDLDDSELELELQQLNVESFTRPFTDNSVNKSDGCSLPDVPSSVPVGLSSLTESSQTELA